VTVSALHPRSANRRLTCAADLTEALGIDFSDQQLAAITAPLEPGVIIAGAGSGKTTVMAARVVWLVGTGAVRPEEVLGLTFTRKAAAELSARVRAALLRAGVVSDSGIDESGEQLIMTYDAFAARLVSEHGLRLGFEADPTLISGATRFRLAARVVKAAAGPFEFISRLRPATVTERVLKLDADLRQHLVDPAQLDLHARSYLVALESAPTNNRGNPYADVKRAIVAAQERLELASLVQDYQELKMRLGLVEFADQMAIAARLATEVPAVPRALRQAFHVVLLDEYQDTSAAQAIMLQGLFSGATPSQGLGHPVTAVGDPFQAIYGWRGAAASNILQFADDFRTVTGQRSRRFALTVNRRSGQSILDVANVLSRPLRARTTTMLAGGAADAPLPARPGVAGSGVSGSGVAGSGVAGSGPAGRGSTDSGPAGRGPTDSGLAEPGRAERAPVGADLAESGPAEPALVEATGGDAAGLGLLRAPADARPGQVRAATFDTWEEEVAWVCDSIVAAREQGVARHRGADPAQRRHRPALRRADRAGRARGDRGPGWAAAPAGGDGHAGDPAARRRRHCQP
jgi:DNA helicase-2/ATP-dependent DNA helicase PcrA